MFALANTVSLSYLMILVLCFISSRVEQELMARMISEMATRQETMQQQQPRGSRLAADSADSSMLSDASSQTSMGKVDGHYLLP